MAKKKKDTRLSNANRCYKPMERMLLVTLTLLMLIPAYNVVFFNQYMGYNVIDWKDYYDSNNDSYFNFGYEGGNSSIYTNGSSIFTTTGLEIGMNFNNDPVQGYLDEVNVSLLSGREIAINFGNESNNDKIYYDQYEFDKKVIKEYREVILMTLGFQLFPVLTPMVFMNYNISSSINISEYFYFLPYNWSDVWDNLEYYMYYINEDNVGYGYSFGIKESLSFNDYRDMTLLLNSNTLDLRIYDVNITADLVYEDGEHPSTVYDGKQLELETINLLIDFITKYLEDQGVDPDIFFDQLEEVIDLFGTTTIFSLTQLRGFYSHPSFKCSKCGYYIRLKQGFNITQYFEDFPLMTDNFTNGLLFYSGGLFLGELATIDTIIFNILTQDLIGFIVIIGGMGFMCLILRKSNKYNEWNDEYKQYCNLNELSKN